MAKYIEREAAKNILLQHQHRFTCADEANGYGSVKWSEDVIYLSEAVNGIDAIPAADVRSVVRGKWEDVNVRDYSTNINGGLPLNVASMCCSVCKRWHNEVYHYGNPTEMAHFCPNCGADMREADNGED